MNSFSVTAVGNLARDPELVSRGDTSHTRFCLVGSDYAGKDEAGAAREVVTSLWFVAFGALGEAIARNARKGDQLILDAPTIGPTNKARRNTTTRLSLRASGLEHRAARSGRNSQHLVRAWSQARNKSPPGK